MQLPDSECLKVQYGWRVLWRTVKPPAPSFLRVSSRANGGRGFGSAYAKRWNEIHWNVIHWNMIHWNMIH